MEGEIDSIKKDIVSMREEILAMRGEISDIKKEPFYEDDDIFDEDEDEDEDYLEENNKISVLFAILFIPLSFYYIYIGFFKGI